MRHFPFLVLLISPGALAQTERPFLSTDWRGLAIDAQAIAAARVEEVSAFPVDAQRTLLASEPVLSPLVRLSLKLDTKALAGMPLIAEYEQDLLTGSVSGDASVPGEALPIDPGLALELRKASVRASFSPVLHATAGITTSYWGLGLLANDGAHGWTPKSAQFVDPRGGDRVLRGMLVLGPEPTLGAVGTLAVDRAWNDEALFTATELDREDGDRAVQFIAAVLVGRDRPTRGGVYLVRRNQASADQRRVDVTVLDVYGETRLPLTDGVELYGGVEGALIRGSATLAPTIDHARHDVLQLGAAARAGVDFGRLGGIIDFLYASGDRNPDDGAQHAFRADPNYPTGLLLFRQVLAAHTGRAVATAGDPTLVGEAPPDLERFATRGSATNTLAVFPRLWWQPLPGLEVYGGPLMAWSEVELSDPLNTRLSGGVPRNALDGEPGRYLGTEVDLGARYELTLGDTTLHAGIEAGMLWPGEAFANDSGGALRNVAGGRLIFAYRI